MTLASCLTWPVVWPREPFVSLTDMNFHPGSIPTMHQVHYIHQPANHQAQDFKNCATFSGNVFDNEHNCHHPAMPHLREKTLAIGDQFAKSVNVFLYTAGISVKQ